MNVTFMIRFQRLTYRQAVSPLPSHLHAVMEQAARLRLERLNIARNYTWSLANNQRGTKALSPTACEEPCDLFMSSLEINSIPAVTLIAAYEKT